MSRRVAVTPPVRVVPAGSPKDWGHYLCRACGHDWSTARVRYPLCPKCGNLGGLERTGP